MLQSESGNAAGQRKARALAKQRTLDRTKEAEDVRIQETNNSSIVSKRSVEKLYYKDDSEWFCYFVNKLKRRSPPINRGYWLRMRAIEHTIEQFLQEPTSRRKIVVNLGCGYDPLPWLFLGGKRRAMCANTMFIDVDYPLLMEKKMAVLKRTPQLTDVLSGLTYTANGVGVMCSSQEYIAVGCDLGQPVALSTIFRALGVDDTVSVLFVAEVSIAYMDMPGSQGVIEWASSFKDARFCLLEQHLPDGKDHPFAVTMLKHFDKIGTSLRAIGTMQEMQQRFVKAGWPHNGVHIQSLWRLWSDPAFLTNDQRRALDAVEPFDEWEELALFASHYFLLVAKTIPGTVEEPQIDVVPRRGPIITCTQHEGRRTDVRRFATIIPPMQDGSPIGITGGSGSEGRLADTATWVKSEQSKTTPFPAQDGLVHQAAALLGCTDDCLLTGGRASPSHVSRTCWLRHNGHWKRAQDMPVGLYRHCAVSYVYDGIPGVLIFGGETEVSTISANVYCFEQARGWYQLAVSGDIPSPRFGAAMDSELLLGGVDDTGTICEDVYEWTRNEEQIIFHKVGDRYAVLGPSLHRVGACLVNWQVDGNLQRLLIGGVGSRDLLTRNTEILNLTTSSAHPIIGLRPLFVGFNLQDRTCIAGGATCFSFGTYWNPTFDLLFENESHYPVSWRLQPSRPERKVAMSSALRIPSVVVSDSFNDFTAIVDAGKPIKLQGLALGSCLNKWTPQYLTEKLGQRQVVVHSSQDLKLDFITKNFQYITQSFAEFMKAAETGQPSYLRALSNTLPSKEPANLAVDFPEIADDFRVPSALSFVSSNAHSSVLRIAAAKTVMWLHYDVMANILCQIQGRKTLYLYPPSDIEHLGIGPGSSSSSFDVFGSRKEHSSLRHCHAHEVTLVPGDVLFIPPLWSHTAKPTGGMSVAVNIFFRDLAHGYAAGRDVYGNRDLAAYEKGRKDVAMIAKAFAPLPASTRHFYLKRLAMELSSLADG